MKTLLLLAMAIAMSSCAPFEIRVGYMQSQQSSDPRPNLVESESKGSRTLQLR